VSILPPEVAALVERFARNRDSYRNATYNETQTRREFIDPLFKALGWDLDNVGGLAEAYKDVIHEDAIKVGGATKAPDYCFRIGGTRKFFVEAKKPAVGLETDPEPAYQLRRYAWTSKLPLSVLTDFEEFAVYDCRIPPKVGDKASVARVFYGTCDQYAANWDYIAGLFSKDAVLKGAFDEYAESNKRKKGTAEVDTEFLRQIEAWRLALAQNFALRNPSLAARDLNFAVQRTIDRLVFLRMCEDRGIEIYGGLQALCATRSEPRPAGSDRADDAGALYQRLAVLFRQADDKYNSGLFYFTAEAGREPPDTFTLALKLDDKVLKDIIRSLYYPESPYEFSVLPPEILGQVYEQFLGKVIRLTAGHHAKVEEKPEVRKAGGVYYTPAYIVAYIVKNTVGKLLEERVPGLGARGSGLGARGSGLGDGDLGDTRHGDQALSGSGSVAEGDGPRGAGVPGGEGAAAQRAVRADQPDSAGGGVDSCEHRGGPRADTPGRLPPSPFDVAGLAGGVGNAPDTGGSPRSPEPGGRPADLGPLPGRRAAPERAHRRAAKKGTRAPSPESPAPIPGPLRILDPACGSGSFLLGAYQFLLNWHRDFYVAGLGVREPGLGVRDSGLGKDAPPATPSPGPRAPGPDLRDRIYQAPGGQWLLTIQEKKRILLNHIYGVDIDPQAVETTKLSLLLKVLEGETEQTIGSTLRLFHERALPDLDRNIKCGNSLIGPDFYEHQQLTMFDEDERLRINAFDWAAEFPEVFRGSGSGSRVSGSKSRTPDPESLSPGPGPRTPSSDSGFDAVIGNPPYIQLSMAAYYNEQVSAYLLPRYASSMGRLNSFGLFIDRAIRSLLRPGGLLSFIVPNTLLTQEYYEGLRAQILSARILNITTYRYPVFAGAVVETVVLVIRNVRPEAADTVDIVQCDNRAMADTHHTVEQLLYNNTHRKAFLVKLDPTSAALRTKLDAVAPKLGDIANINQAIALKYDRSASIFPKALGKNFKRVLDGRNIQRYHLTWGGEYLAYDVNRIHSCKRIDIFECAEKLFFRRVGDRLIATYDTEQFYALNTLVVITLRDPSASLKYLLGLINSRLLNYYYVTFLKSTKTIFSEIQARQLAQLPMPSPDGPGTKQGPSHNRLDALVQQMLDLHKSLAAANTAHEQTALQRQIDATDRQIDQLVYELYGLSDDEIKIVEEATA
jgi:hypothetical protein